MAGVLTEAPGSQVTCAHKGNVQTTGTAKLKVSTYPVLLENGIDGQSIKGCLTPITPTTPTPPPYTSFPCLMVSATTRTSPSPANHKKAITAGRSKKLKVGGSPVMLDTLAGQTDGMVSGANPVIGLTGTVTQSKLTAV